MQHKKYIYLILGIFLGLGFCFGIWYKEYIVCIWHGGNTGHKSVEQLRATLTRAQKKVSICVPTEQEPYTLIRQEVTVPWFEHNLEANMQQVVAQWLILLHEEGFTSMPVTVQFLGYNTESATLYVSFSHDFLQRSWSCACTMAVIESLLKTLSSYTQEVQQVQFLINHGIVQHPMIDLTYPWPLFGFSKT
jgi:hypothetical protein